MKKHMIIFEFLIIAVLIAGCANAQDQDKAFTIKVVPPVSEVKVLPTGDVEKGYESDELTVLACRGEYEPVSFVISASKDIADLKIEATDLKGKNGTIPAKQVDIKVVKCWYQGPGAWRDIYGEEDEINLVPELLLNDDKMIMVDYGEKKNYMRHPITNDYFCISEPGKPDPNWANIDEKFPLKDSDVLLPVDISAGTNKQFWITVHVPDDAKAGVYTGNINLANSKIEPVQLTLKVRVLPFELLPPYYTSGIYYRNPYPYNFQQRYEKELHNMMQHGVTSPMLYQTDVNNILTYLKIRNQYQQPVDKSLYLIYDLGSTLEEIKPKVDFLKSKGFSDVYFCGIDEAGGDRLTGQRPRWEMWHEAGAKAMAAGGRHEHFKLMGDIQDLFICFGRPTKEEAAKWHSVGHRVVPYGYPFGGVESPELNRRNYGLLIWQEKNDGAMTYVYKHCGGSCYNDFDTRDLVMAYPTVNGVIDTIEWEGYREGVDDVRYVTTLQKAIEKAEKNSDAKIKKVAEDAQEYLDNLDITTRNMDTVRAEMIDFLLQLERSN